MKKSFQCSAERRWKLWTSEVSWCKPRFLASKLKAGRLLDAGQLNPLWGPDGGSLQHTKSVGTSGILLFVLILSLLFLGRPSLSQRGLPEWTLCFLCVKALSYLKAAFQQVMGRREGGGAARAPYHEGVRQGTDKDGYIMIFFVCLFLIVQL